MAYRTAGVLLAGGRSRRMGSEKPLVQVGGTPLIERVAAAVSPCVDELVLVTNRPELYEFLGIRTITDADLYASRGPLAGIHAALTQIGSPSALVVASDYPFLTSDALRRITREDPLGGIVLPQIDGSLHPLCSHYATGVASVIEESLASGELMVLSLVGRLRKNVLTESEFGLEDASRAFFNVNTPEDLRRAEDLLAQAEPRR